MTEPCGSAEFPISTSTRSRGTRSASAAICARTVRAPVPRSVALVRTRYVPSGKAWARAAEGAMYTG